MRGPVCLINPELKPKQETLPREVQHTRLSKYTSSCSRQIIDLPLVLTAIFQRPGPESWSRVLVQGPGPGPGPGSQMPDVAVVTATAHICRLPPEVEPIRGGEKESDASFHWSNRLNKEA